MTDSPLADEPVPTRIGDSAVTSHPGATLLGVIPHAARERALARARGSRPLSGADPEEEDRPPRPLTARPERTDHVEVWTHLDALRPQADRRIAKRVARIARGFTVAAVAVIGLVAIGYVATSTFFVFSKTWIVPVVVPVTDERVVALERELALHQQARERLAAEVAAAERAVAALASALARPLRARPRTGRDVEAMKRELAQATARRDTAAANLAHRDQMIAVVKASPYLRAAAGGAVMAVAPYGHLDEVGVGTAVYACKLQMVWCRQVGTVTDVLRGDVTFDHPHRNRKLVGRMLELRLSDRAAERAEVLFVGGAPLWL